MFMFVLACIVCMSSAFCRVYGLFSLVYGGTRENIWDQVIDHFVEKQQSDLSAKIPS